MITKFESVPGIREGKSFGFVDADNVKKGFEAFLKRNGISDENLEYFSLGNLISQSQAHRFFVYSAVKNGEAPEQWIAELRSKPKFVFKSANLKTAGNKPKQEGVDVYLAVEAMQHAFKRTMTNCILFSGDGDLLPLINALVHEGITTIVASFDNSEKSDVAARQRDAADFFVRLCVEAAIDSVVPEHHWVSTGGMARSAFMFLGEEIKIHAKEKTYVARKQENGRVLVPLTLNGDTVTFSSFSTEIGAQLFLQIKSPTQHEKLL